MSKTLAEVTRDAIQLTPKQRKKLTNTLLSLDVEERPVESEREIAKAWDDEIQRRISEHRAGRSTLIPWSEVKRDIEEMLTK